MQRYDRLYHLSHCSTAVGHSAVPTPNVDGESSVGTVVGGLESGFYIPGTRYIFTILCITWKFPARRRSQIRPQTTCNRPHSPLLQARYAMCLTFLSRLGSTVFFACLLWSNVLFTQIPTQSAFHQDCFFICHEKPARKQHSKHKPSTD